MIVITFIHMPFAWRDTADLVCALVALDADGAVFSLAGVGFVTHHLRSVWHIWHFVHVTCVLRGSRGATEIWGTPGSNKKAKTTLATSAKI